MNNLISIYKTFDTIQADIIKSHFEAEGIYCFIRSNDASGTMPYLGISQGGADVMVREEDLEKSRELLKDCI